MRTWRFVSCKRACDGARGCGWGCGCGCIGCRPPLLVAAANAAAAAAEAEADADETVAELLLAEVAVCDSASSSKASVDFAWAICERSWLALAAGGARSLTVRSRAAVAAAIEFLRFCSGCTASFCCFLAASSASRARAACCSLSSCVRNERACGKVAGSVPLTMRRCLYTARVAMKGRTILATARSPRCENARAAHCESPVRSKLRGSTSVDQRTAVLISVQISFCRF